MLETNLKKEGCPRPPLPTGTLAPICFQYGCSANNSADGPLPILGKKADPSTPSMRLTSSRLDRHARTAISKHCTASTTVLQPGGLYWTNLMLAIGHGAECLLASSSVSSRLLPLAYLHRPFIPPSLVDCSQLVVYLCLLLGLHLLSRALTVIHNLSTWPTSTTTLVRHSDLTRPLFIFSFS